MLVVFLKLLGSVKGMQGFHHTLIAPGSKFTDVERFLCHAYSPSVSYKMLFSKASPSPLLIYEASMNLNDIT